MLMAIWWTPLAATLSLITICHCKFSRSHVQIFSNVKFAAWTASVAPRLVLGGLFLGGLLAEAEANFVCATVVASTPRTSHFEVATCLVVMLARLCVSGGWPATYAWLPAFLFIQKLLCNDQSVLFSSSSAVSEGASEPRGVSGQADRGIDEIVNRFPNWVPPTRIELRRWTRAFHVNDKLLAVYACTVQLKVAHRGYLYLSAEYVCFQATGFGTRSLQLSLALDDIQEVRDEEGQNGSKLVLRRPTELKYLSGPTTVIEIRDCAAGQVAIAVLVQRHHGSEEDDDTFERETSIDFSSNASASASASTATHDVDRRVSGHKMMTSFAEGESFRHLLEVHILGLEVTSISEELAFDEWKQGSLIFDHYEGIGGWNIDIGPWIDDSDEPCGGVGCGDGPRLRELNMEMPVPPAPMCPKSTRMTATMCLLASKSTSTQSSLTLLCTTVSHDVPFGEKFVVQERIELVPLENGEGVRFCKHGRVVFIKSCGILNSRIASSTAAELTRTGEKLVALLKQRAPSPDPLDPLVPSGKVTFVVHIWELQRRVTVWSKTWKPPFLPHDGRKRWRWVDPAYQVHAWMSAESREAAAASTLPPIQPWQGYKVLKAWQVGRTSDGCDDDGWQYATDFYHQDKYWGGTASGSHVRRRLWTCTFIEA